MVLCFIACGEEKEGELLLPPVQENKEETELPLVQEVLTGVLDSWFNIETYQFDMKMMMDMSAEGGEEALI